MSGERSLGDIVTGLVARSEPEDGGTLLTIRPLDEPRVHLDNLVTERVFFDARNDYFATLVDDLWLQPVVPQLKELVTTFESEAAWDVVLRCRTNIVSRSRRSFVMEQSARRADDDGLVATCRSVHITVDTNVPAAVEIPDAFWQAVERREAGARPA